MHSTLLSYALLAAQAGAATHATTRLHDLTGLFERPELERIDSDRARGNMLQAWRASLAVLEEFVRAQIRPEPGGSFACRAVERDAGPALALVGTPRQQLWLRRMLAHNGVAQSAVLLQASILALEPTAFDTILRPALGARSIVVLPAERRDFVRRLRAAPGTTAAGGTLPMRPLREGSLVHGNEFSYVARFDVQRSPAGMIADPVVSVAHDGLSFRGCAAVVAQGRIGVSFEVTHAKLKLPIPVREVSLNGLPHKVRIQVPDIRQVSVRSSLTLARGSTAVIPLPELPGEKRRCLVLRAAD